MRFTDHTLQRHTRYECSLRASVSIIGYFTAGFCGSPKGVTETMFCYPRLFINEQDDQKVCMHIVITTHKVTSNVQTVPRQSPDIY
jgi:hypothetical protein